MDNLNDNIEKFRQDAKLCIDYVCEYGKTVDKKSVVPNIKPGYLIPLMPCEAPQEPEEVKEILNDFEKLIMPGTLHWMHPKFYAYFPGGNAYPNILADILCTAIGGNGFTWTSQPSCTELENIMMDWYARALDLPNHFIFEESNGKGGGCIQNTASDAIFSTIVAARNVPLQIAGCYDRQGRASSSTDVSSLHPAIIVSKLVCYTSSESHSCVQKAAKLALCTIRVMTPNEKNQITGEMLEQYILKDKANDLIPFYCCATMGTTGAATFDHLASIGPCCKKYKLWLHVDGAYGGNTFLLPEMRYLKEGMEYADSFTINPYKLMLGAVDLNCMWVRDTAAYKKCFIINATYLIDQNEEDNNKYEIDYRHYGIPLSRRMRSLKLWFLFRCYGISGLQNYIRNIINCAKVFEKLVNEDPRFEVCNDVLTGLVCFRQKDLTGDGSTESQTSDEHSLKLVDKLNINLLLRINDSRKLHICPCTLQEKFVLRFSVNNEFASPKDIEESWKIIQSFYVSEIDEDLKLHFAKTASESNRAASRLAFTTLLDSQEYMDYKKDLQNQIRLTFSKIVIRNDADVSSILKLPKYNETDPAVDDKHE